MGKMTDERFTSLYNENMSFVYRIAFSYLKNKEESENVMQETFMKLYLNPPKDDSKIKNWLVGVTKNLCLNQLKKQKKEKEVLSVMAKNMKLDNRQSESTGKVDILFCMNRIPEKYASVLRMYYLGEMSIKAIASSMDINEDTVKKRLERGRKLLKEEYEKEQRHGKD